MRHHGRLTNPTSLELRFSVRGRRVLKRLCEDSPEPISIHQRSQWPTEIASNPSCSPPAGPMTDLHRSTFATHSDNSIPIRPAAVERFSPIHF